MPASSIFLPFPSKNYTPPYSWLPNIITLLTIAPTGFILTSWYEPKKLSGKSDFFSLLRMKLAPNQSEPGAQIKPIMW